MVLPRRQAPVIRSPQEHSGATVMMHVRVTRRKGGSHDVATELSGHVAWDERAARIPGGMYMQQIE